MEKRQRKVLSVLKTKTKQLGFSRSELKGIAAKIADDLDIKEDASEEEEDSAINEAVDDAMDFLKVSQSAAQRVISNFKNTHKITENNDDDEDEENADEQKNQTQQNQKKPTNDKDETPAWAKGLMEQLTAMSERVSGLEKNNVSKGRRGRLENKLKNTGRFGERRLKEFDRIKDTFKTEEEFDEYLDEISDDLEKYNQERADAGLSKLGAPGASAPDKTKQEPSKDEDSPLSDAEIEALAKEF